MSTYSSARSDDPGFSPGYVYDNFTLGNGVDEIVLGDGLTELLRLDYSAGFVEAGRSNQLSGLPMLASNYALSPGSLTYGAGDIGTPGATGNAGPITSTFADPANISHPVSSVPVPAAIWLFITGILMLLSARSISSSPRKRRFGAPRPCNDDPTSFQRVQKS